MRCSARDFLDEFIQFIASDVANCPEIESFLRPMPDVIALDAIRDRPGMRRAQMLRDEQIDYVFATLVDNRGDRLAVDVIQAPAKKGEAFRGQIDDRRGDVDPAVEPRLDGVPIAGLDIH